jgi:hypothetical protein
MISGPSDYTFNNMGRIGSDSTDNTQRNIQNTHYSNIVLSNYFSEKPHDSYIRFSTQQPGIMFNGVSGIGLNSDVVDNESTLLRKTQEERSLDKLQLFTRPFITVPYLGKGSCDPTLESQLQQGEYVRGKKSVSTIMEQNFYGSYPVELKNPSIEELALDGWGRGGKDTRTTGDKYNHK